jgi:hypothetical protein
MFVTLDVSHELTLWLKAEVPSNMWPMSVTRDVFQPPVVVASAVPPLLKAVAPKKHVQHGRDFGRVPRTHVLVEGGGAIEHVTHVSDEGRVPALAVVGSAVLLLLKAVAL